MATILVIDDNETIREGLAHTVRRMGHEPLIASSGRAGVELFRRHGNVDFVITDLKMEDGGGAEVLRQVFATDPDAVAMVITAYGNVETAVECMKLGAFDFLTKPFAPEVVRLKIEGALALRAARRARSRAEATVAALHADAAAGYGEMVGASTGMRQVFAMIEKVAPTDASVLVVGESGTGKELVARALHTRSRRAAGPFIKVNCSALAETLLESELFGHEKGSFTGAVKRKLGRFELADGGTLFLDEIGDISQAMQLRLLRVLQERELERVGGEQTIRVDVRVVAATHKDLAAEVKQGRFREDLFYRLHVVPMTLPPLRDRRDDVPQLARHFVAKLAPRTNARVTGLDDAALGRLVAWSWPGNVRELENAIEQALVFADGETIGVAALPPQLRGEDPDALALPKTDAALPDILEELERQLLVKAYTKAGGVKTETARLLGIKPSALYYKLEKYGII